MPGPQLSEHFLFSRATLLGQQARTQRAYAVSAHVVAEHDHQKFLERVDAGDMFKSPQKMRRSAHAWNPQALNALNPRAILRMAYGSFSAYVLGGLTLSASPARPNFLFPSS